MNAKLLFQCLVFSACAGAQAADPGWQADVSVPFSSRIGQVDGASAEHFYLGLGLDAGATAVPVQAHAAFQGMLGPFMFADMNQPNELDLGLQYAKTLDAAQRTKLMLGGGPAFFSAGNGRLSFLDKNGWYGNAALAYKVGRANGVAGFLQYSAGTTDIHVENGNKALVKTSGISFGIQYRRCFGAGA